MCENFVCVKLAGEDYKSGSTERALPEPCYEYINCQICELMYNCDFCASRDRCKQYPAKTPEKRKTLKNAGKRDH